jgi:hypothetical protein
LAWKSGRKQAFPAAIGMKFATNHSASKKSLIDQLNSLKAETALSFTEWQ